MMDEFNFKLILNNKEYLIPPNFPSFDDIDVQIHTILTTNGQYIVKSKVSKITFQTFLDNWVNNSSLNIRTDNIEDYILLSQEFDRIKAEISLFKKMPHSHNSYIEKKNQTLNKKFEKILYNLENKTRKFHLIIDHLFNNTGIDSHSRFLEIRTDLYKACMKEKVNFVNLLTQKEIKTENGFSLIINEEAKTAGIFRTYLTKDKYFIPRTVRYNNYDYTITIIHQYAFKNSHVNTIEFDENSEIQIIEKYAFYKTNIKSIKLPKHVKYIGKYAFEKCMELCFVDFNEESELEVIESKAFSNSIISKISLPAKILQFKDGWCFGSSCLTNIIVSQNNDDITNIVFFNDMFLIGKSDPEINVFDYLIFARRDIEKAQIPEFIRIIGPYAFECCKSLKSIEFPENSELEIIEQNAFSKSSIVNISIPEKVTKIGDNCFSECKNIEKIVFSYNSKLESIGKRAFLFSPIKKIDDGLGSLKFNRLLNSIKPCYNPNYQYKLVLNKSPTHNLFTTTISIPSSVSYLD